MQYALDTFFPEILELKPIQEEALLHFITREDVFVVLPTGCGKSLIFQLVQDVLSDKVNTSQILNASNHHLHGSGIFQTSS